MLKEFKDVVGYEDVKIELERIVDIMRNAKKYKALGVKMPRGMMLVGDPGTGKTLMSKCFIKASKLTSFTLRKDIPDGSFVKEIKKTFKNAKENAPSIVFLDDMDKFSNTDVHHRNADEYVTVQSCIDSVKDKDVFVLATANDLECVPDSLLRPGRFDKCIFVRNPNLKDCELISKHYLKKKKIASDIDYKEVARLLDGRSCAALETVINEAGVYAGFENRELIEMKDIIKAFTRVVYNAPETLEFTDSKYLKATAVHEAGHAIVAEILEPESVNIVTIERHDGGIGGFAKFTNNEDYFESKHFMENRIMALLAGKAAAEIVLGIQDVGATSDINRAYSVAERFVNNYCCYGFGYREANEYKIVSHQLADRKTANIQTELERYYMKAKYIIANNREFLDKLVEVLMENKTIVFNEIQSIKKTCQINEPGRELIY